MRAFLLGTLWIAHLATLAQLPASRQVDWWRAGASVSLDNLPVRKVVDVVSDLGFDTTGATDVSGALNTAINTAGVTTVFYFPYGTYLFNNQVNMKSNCIIKGLSPEKTEFVFTLSSGQRCFNIVGGTRGSRLNVNSGYSKGSTSITLAATTGLKVGDYIEIRQDNDPYWDTNPQTYAANAIGQITKIEAINGNILTLRDPLTYDYSAIYNPQVIRARPIQNVGFESFYVRRTDDAGSSTSRPTFRFNWAVECWIKGVHSFKASHQHIEMARTAFCTVSGSYFDDAHRHDNTGGAKAYGLNLVGHTNFCLFENNIFRNLRHSMSVSIGSNGNVISYNYSFDRKSQDCFIICLWVNDKADLHMHGHYPFANLFEGNIVEYVHSDQVFGISGPNNTFLRNRTINASPTRGIFIDNVGSAIPDYQAFLGNEIISGTYDVGTGSNQYECENNHAGVLKGTDCVSGLTADSYYLSGEPEFWNISDTWPSIGVGNTPGSGTIPAKYRVDQGLEPTFPASSDSCIPGSVYYDETLGRFRWCENGIWVVK